MRKHVEVRVEVVLLSMRVRPEMVVPHVAMELLEHGIPVVSLEWPFQLKCGVLEWFDDLRSGERVYRWWPEGMDVE